MWVWKEYYWRGGALFRDRFNVLKLNSDNDQYLIGECVQKKILSMETIRNVQRTDMRRIIITGHVDTTRP